MRGYSPQEHEIAAFSLKYVNAEPNLAFILPANFIRKQVSRTVKKQNKSAESQSVISSLFCGFKDKVNYRTNKTFPSNRHSFIDSLDSGSSESSTTKRSLTPELLVTSNNGKMNNNLSSGSSSSAKFSSSISSPNLAKQDSASSSTSGSNRLLNSELLSEDYAHIMAERERKNEEQRERRMSGSRGTQTPSSGSSANGDINRTPKSKKKTVMLQPAPNRDIKPSTILRLEDRDLVVIDKQDIKEAVRNESDVIIVDPPTMPAVQTPSENDTAELSDILGNQWPELAGSNASLLNNEKRGNSSITNGWRTVERNKSTNIASHFSNSKPRYENGNRKSE